MSHRIFQINELLRGELANLISQTGLLADGLITVTYVKTSPDLKFAHIGVSILPEHLRGTALKNLRRESRHFFNILKKKLNLKIIPKFKWEIDEQERHAADMDKIFDNL